MLVLTRKRNESIVVGDNIEITVVDIQGDQVRIGINAPKSVSIHRKEIYLEIQAENKKGGRCKESESKGFIKERIAHSFFFNSIYNSDFFSKKYKVNHNL